MNQEQCQIPEATSERNAGGEMDDPDVVTVILDRSDT